MSDELDKAISDKTGRGCLLLLALAILLGVLVAWGFARLLNGG